jgi:predicted PurR-regulated permease PerM
MSSLRRVPEPPPGEPGAGAALHPMRPIEAPDPADPMPAAEGNGREPDAPDRMKLPRNPQTLLLLGIFILLLFYGLYLAGSILLPIIFAGVLYLVLQPAMRQAARFHIPRALAAILMITLVIGSIGALGVTVAAPAAEWVSKAPESLRRIDAQLWLLKRPIADLENASKQIERIAEGPAPSVTPVALAGPGVTGLLFSGTRNMLIGLGTTVVLLFFLLISGDLFLRRFVEILPTLSNKKQAVEISREIESNISAYLATVSLMNLGVGVLTGLAAAVCGLSDPILWGTMAFLLNYVPILGPLCGVILLFLASLLSFGTLWQAMLPAGIYLGIHLLEGEIVTPMLLARRFILNPVLVVVSLVFWYWMWGIAGALLAVPMLATTKIICDRIKPLMALGHFLGSEPRS